MFNNYIYPYSHIPSCEPNRLRGEGGGGWRCFTSVKNTGYIEVILRVSTAIAQI